MSHTVRTNSHTSRESGNPIRQWYRSRVSRGVLLSLKVLLIGSSLTGCAVTSSGRIDACTNNPPELPRDICKALEEEGKLDYNGNPKL